MSRSFLGNDNIVKLLIENGLNVDAVDRDNKTALALAAVKGMQFFQNNE